MLAAPGLRLDTVEDLIDLEQNIRLGSGPPGWASSSASPRSSTLKKMDLDDWQERGHVLRLSGTGQRFDDWKDERLDAVFTFVNDPSPQLTELAVTRPARFLSMPPGLRNQMVERWRFVELTLPPGTYPHQDDPVETVALPSLLFAVDAVDESIVYALTKALYEHRTTCARCTRASCSGIRPTCQTKCRFHCTRVRRVLSRTGLLPATVATAQRF